MKIPSQRTRHDMELAAELRAAGATWDTIGEKVKRHPNVVVRWTSVYRDEWQQLLREAERRAQQLGTDETRSTMRLLLRHDDARLRIGAADQLTKLLRAELAERQPDDTSDLTAFLAHVEEMSDDELQESIAEFIEFVRSAQGDENSTAGLASPAGAEGSD